VSKITLHQGDCLEYLKTLEPGSVDAVVTSPPYNTLPASHKPSGFRADRKTGVDKWAMKCAHGYFDQRPEQEYQSWLIDILTECVRVCRGIVWVNHKVRYREGVALHPARMFSWPIYSEIIWDRGGSMALNCQRFAPSHEMILGFGRPVWWNQKLNKLCSVWKISQEMNRTDHPCPYPLEIPKRLIEASCPPNGIVLDPFSGSGTTGVACVRTGRNFLGCEIDPGYYAIAQRRIADEQAKTALLETAS